MATAEVGVPEVPRVAEVDTGRLENASRARVVLIVLAVVASTEIVPFQVSFIGLSARYIGASFPSAGTQLPWLATIYALVGGIAVPVAGKLSDLIGKKRIMLVCLAFSLLGSVLDAVTHSWTVLLIGRALQGLAFPAIAVSYGLIRDLAPRRMVNMAIALAGGGTGVGAILGPLAGGALTDHYSWRSLFWFCAIWTVVTMIPLLLLVPESRLRARVALDLPGAALLGAGAGLLLIYLSRGSDWGWHRASSLGWLLGGLALMAVFAWWETQATQPIMSPALLRSPRVLSVLGLTFLANGALQGVSYVGAYLAETPGGAAGDAVKQQIVDGAAQAAAAQAHLPASALTQFFSVQGELPGLNLTLFQFTLKITLGLAVMYVIFAPLTGWLSTRSGLRRPAAFGMLSFAVACVLLAFFHHGVLQIALIFLLFGVAAGCYLGSVPNMIVEAVPQEQQGVSAGMAGAFNSFGAAAATSVVASVLAAHPLVLHFGAPGHVTDTPLNTGALAQLSAGTAYTQLLVIFAVVGAVGFVLALTMGHYRHAATGGTRY